MKQNNGTSRDTLQATLPREVQVRSHRVAGVHENGKRDKRENAEHITQNMAHRTGQIAQSRQKRAQASSTEHSACTENRSHSTVTGYKTAQRINQRRVQGKGTYLRRNGTAK